ncbi:hypothetical protein ACP4J4_14125 [Aureimonas ureilytica]|uniref:hypothetical protein n=1 Tax=Aureimonas TaxID=414371 RepID=UPI000782ADA3|nr:hypothetical protein [Aureimonas sp. D3]
MTTYSDLRKSLWQAMREAEDAYLKLRDEAGASDDDLALGRRCDEAITVAWRLAGILADET